MNRAPVYLSLYRNYDYDSDSDALRPLRRKVDMFTFSLRRARLSQSQRSICTTRRHACGILLTWTNGLTRAWRRPQAQVTAVIAFSKLIISTQYV